MRFQPTAIALYAATLLAACGGGDSVPTTSTAQFSLDAAMSKLMTSSRTLTGTAVDGADTYTLSLSVAPAADATFEGLASKQASQSVTIKRNGVTLASTGYQQFFTLNPFHTRGATYADGTYAVVTKSNGTLPTAASVGASGPLDSVRIFSDSTKMILEEIQDSTWSMEVDTASTAYGCVNSVSKNITGMVEGTTAGCFQIDANNNVLGMRYTVDVAGKTLTFR